MQAGSGQPPASPQQLPRCPPPCLQLPRPGVSLQVHLRCEELKLIPQQARMKRRQKSRMLVNDSSGWPTAPGWRALHTTGTAKCVWHQTIISLEVCGAGALRAILTAKQPAMSANKTTRREASLSLLPSPHRGLGFFFLCCPSCWGICSSEKKAGQTSSNGVFSASPRVSAASLPFSYRTWERSSIYGVAS